MSANVRTILIETLRDAHGWLDELLSDPRLTLESLASRRQDRAFDPDDPVARFQALKSPMRSHFLKARVKVHVYPDGSHALFHGPRCIGRYDEKGRLKDDGPVQHAA